jgi:hypothetical protein
LRYRLLSIIKIYLKNRNFGNDPRRWRIWAREVARQEQEDVKEYSRSSSKSSSRLRFSSREKRNELDLS